MALQKYFSSMSDWKLSGESRDKIRDVLASVLRTAVKKYWLLVTNPIDGIQLPPNKTGKRKTKPFLSPEQFDELVHAIPEPYATMVYVATYSGLRISELIGLKWHDLGSDSITIDERYCLRRLVGTEEQRFQHNDRRGSLRNHADPSPQTAHRRSEGGTRNSQIQTREVGRPGRSGFPERARREADARQQHSHPIHQARRPRARPRFCELALPAHVQGDMDDRSGS